AGHIDALPEARCCKEYGVAIFSEDFEQATAAHLPLHQRFPIPASCQQLMRVMHVSVAGEEHKGAPFSDFHQALNFVRHRFYKAWVVGRWDLWRNIKQGLLHVIEG